MSIIVITGVPSSGKTAVARELVSLDESFVVVASDDEIRVLSRVFNPFHQARQILRRVLDKVEELNEAADVVIEGSLPGSYVVEARERFGEGAFFVQLRLSETERQRRERSRRDRSPVAWNEAMTALGGGDDLYDLVIDTTDVSPEDCARSILRAVGTL